jgi:hypothetical protein
MRITLPVGPRKRKPDMTDRSPVVTKFSKSAELTQLGGDSGHWPRMDVVTNRQVDFDSDILAW